MADLRVNYPNTAGDPDKWNGQDAIAVSARINENTMAIAAKIDKSVGTAKGDIAVFNGVSWVRLPKGDNGQAVVYDSSTATGLKAGTVASEGGGGLGNLQPDGSGDYIVVDDAIIDGGAP